MTASGFVFLLAFQFVNDSNAESERTVYTSCVIQIKVTSALCYNVCPLIFNGVEYGETTILAEILQTSLESIYYYHVVCMMTIDLMFSSHIWGKHLLICRTSFIYFFF
jgi:hypothetical protein